MPVAFLEGGGIDRGATIASVARNYQKKYPSMGDMKAYAVARRYVWRRWKL